MSDECNHANCKSKFCPHCGEEVEALPPLDELLSYLAGQVRLRKKQLRDQMDRQAKAKSGRVADQWSEFYAGTKEQFVARRLEEANHGVCKAEKLLVKWEARLVALKELIDASHSRGRGVTHP